jgi:hypothetical protein
MLPPSFGGTWRLHLSEKNAASTFRRNMPPLSFRGTCCLHLSGEHDASIFRRKMPSLSFGGTCCPYLSEEHAASGLGRNTFPPVTLQIWRDMEHIPSKRPYPPMSPYGVRNPETVCDHSLMLRTLFKGSIRVDDLFLVTAVWIKLAMNADFHQQLSRNGTPPLAFRCVLVDKHRDRTLLNSESIYIYIYIYIMTLR